VFCPRNKLSGIRHSLHSDVSALYQRERLIPKHTGFPMTHFKIPELIGTSRLMSYRAAKARNWREQNKCQETGCLKCVSVCMFADLSRAHEHEPILSRPHCSSSTNQLRLPRAVLCMNLSTEAKDPKMVASEGASTF
jgi:hypothetical protein